MKKLTKVISLVLVLAMAATMLTACKKEPAVEVESATDVVVSLTDPYAGMDYETQSSTLYNEVLGDFYATYMAAKEEKDVSTKYAKMAIAEAKLLESGVMQPSTCQGGNYAIGRVAPYTVTPCLWGNDSYRFHQYIVTTEPITSEDRAEMKAKYAEVKGQGTYEAWAKEFLTGKGYTLKDTYAQVYASDPQTWDVLATSLSADSEAIVNTYDGLYEYDLDNILQPALAESYTVSDDGLKYTFKLREGLTWVDSQGRKVADLVADDFVAGMQHMMDAQGGLEYLVQDILVGADAYIAGDSTDFTTVGVKALDNYNVEYTLTAPCSYFMTMLGYGVFAPMSRSYYTSQGGTFGEAYDAEATIAYGTDPDHIAYCGPYVVTNCTAENTIVFKANESYWNKDNINIKTITWLFNDGQDATKSYNDMVAGTIDGCGLNATALELAKQDGNFAKFGYTSATDATAFMTFMNINRAQYANVNDNTAVVSTISESEAVRSNYAMRNVHFRRALCFCLDRAAYNAQSVGEELKLTSLINSYTPGTFVAMDKDVTVDINGTSKTFPAGTFYGEIMQAQIDADGVKMVVWDPKADDGVGSSAGFDGWYSVDNAVAELNTAIEELAEVGCIIDEANPIYLDLPAYSGSETFYNRANAFKQSLENVLGKKVILNLTDCPDAASWYYAGYYTDYGYEANYNLYDVSGWGPDYGDPSTYLDTFLPDYAGYMTKCIGVY